MRDILPTLRSWMRAGGPVGLATVVGVDRSAPRDPGAALARSPAGDVIGSVSGGCVEGAVVEVAERVVASGVPELVHYGISDAEAFSVGLTCGGEIDVFVDVIGDDDWQLFERTFSAIEEDRPIAVATVIDGAAKPGARLFIEPTSQSGTLGDEGLDRSVIDDGRGMLAQGLTGQRRYGAQGQRRAGEVTVFIESFAPRPRMYVFGAIDFAGAVTSIGSFLGYEVVVCDARAVFATRARFPDADEIVVEWPHRFLANAPIDERTAICVLTHDPKFDVPVLEIALRSPAAYIGAMGSRRTHDDRIARLREIGFGDGELARLRSPIGLDIGGRTPQETAVSIAAELIAARHQRAAQPLRDTDGPIHRSDEVVAP